MLFKDFFQFFFNLTISYTRDDYYITRVTEEIPDEEWGICRLNVPKDTDSMFISLYQMNQKFFDPLEDNVKEVTMINAGPSDNLALNIGAALINDQVERENENKHVDDEAYQDKGPGVVKPPDEFDSRDEFANKDLEYPKLELIICRKGKLKPDESDPKYDPGSEPPEMIAYMDGYEAEEACITLRLTDVKKGEYYILYKPDFKDWHTVRRMNLVLYSEFQQKKSDMDILKDQENDESLLKQMRSAVDLKADKLGVDKDDDTHSMPGGKKGAALKKDASKSDIVSERKRAIDASRNSVPPVYDPKMAVELERLDVSSFKPEFYEQMEALNYDRFVDQDKYKPPEFIDPP